MSNRNLRYCLDADSLITPKNGPYGFAIWPDFWVFLAGQVRLGRVYSCWGVYEEWTAGNDELAEWVKEFRADGLCTEPSEMVQMRYKEIVNYVQRTYSEANSAKFLKGGDPWVIAQASIDKTTVVTFETLVDSTSKKCKVPNICQRYGVEWLNLYKVVARIKGA